MTAIQTLMVMLTMGFIGAMTFVAYNHPKQYFYFILFLIASLGLLEIVAFGLNLGKQDAMLAILDSKLDAVNQLVAVEAIKNYETDVPSWLSPAMRVFLIYASFLGILPYIGLTADQRLQSGEDP